MSRRIAAARPSRRRRGARTWAGRAALGAIALAAIVAIWGYVSLRVPRSRSGAAQAIEVEPGMSARAVAQVLADRGLIRSRGWLLAAVRWRRDGRKFQPGVYHFRPGMTALEMLDSLIRGRVAAASITIPEGYTIRQIAHRLEEYGLGLAEGLRRETAHAWAFDTPFPVPQGASLEGYLFPDTYRLPLRRGGDTDLIRLMLARFDEVVWRGALRGRQPNGPPLGPSGRGGPGSAQGPLSLHQVVTLASLVEGEAKVDRERAIIAGVLTNRLRKGMLLQCDATVQYALGDDRRSRLLHADLLTPSPYNTYLHKGLPPGPINNPGLSSIRAALHPADVPYLYYVARADGSHIFSVTFAQHQRAIRQVRAQ